MIEGNTVMIFSKSKCPFCTKVKAIFDKGGVKWNSIDLDVVKDGDKLHNALK